MMNITKRFGTLIANNQITLDFQKGEVHALLGENGAGKSTLMSILFGLYQADEGQIFIDDKQVDIKNPNDANRLGIGMVHQHFKLVEVFTTLENIILGAEDTKYGLLDTTEARKKIQEISTKYHLNVDLDKKIKDITVAQQQRVEILKMLYRDADILIFDEPTAVLAPQEIIELMHILRNFAKEGKTVILITHKLNEIKLVADRCSILKRGNLIKTVNVKDTSVKAMAEMMVGRQVNFEYHIEPKTLGETILELKNVTLAHKNKKPLIDDISFEVRAGEILGIAGIDGNGQTELVECITGLLPVTSGSIFLNGKDMTSQSIRNRYQNGLSHIPEDRQRHGLVLDFTLAYNLVLQSYYKKPFQRFGFINRKEINQYAENLIEQYDIRSANGSKSMMRSMSGGNQQKAIIARETNREHNLLIAVQPTRGLDVGAIEYVHKRLLEERQLDKAILLVSLELDEILDISDRILVIYEGKIVAEFKGKTTTAEEIGLYMSGSKVGKKYDS